MARDDGVDLYAEGLHLALSNVLYFSLLQKTGANGLHSYLKTFQDPARTPTRVTLGHLPERMPR